MIPSFQPNFLPTAVGSLPHTDPNLACELVTRHLPHIPAWPQLPRRDFRESMYAQFSQGFPGITLETDRIYVNRSDNLEPALEALYTRYLADDIDAAAIPPAYAAGFEHFCSLNFGTACAVKGQIVGPISWGLTITDQDRRAILYDEVLADAAAKHLRLQAAWQQRELQKLAPQTIMFLDEPYLASFGSAYVAVERDQVIGLLEEVLSGISGLKGVHCCGNTDWSLLLATSINILNFDAYNFVETLALYPGALRAFLDRGGILAWGIVPVENDSRVMAETVESLMARLEAGLKLFKSKGVSVDALLNASLLTPACGMGTLSEQGAERALSLLADLSNQVRQKYQCLS